MLTKEDIIFEPNGDDIVGAIKDNTFEMATIPMYLWATDALIERANLTNLANVLVDTEIDFYAHFVLADDCKNYSFGDVVVEVIVEDISGAYEEFLPEGRSYFLSLSEKEKEIILKGIKAHYEEFYDGTFEEYAKEELKNVKGN